MTQATATTPTPVLPMSDLSLVRRFAEARDPDAFGELVRRHSGLVFSTCVRILGDAHRAEEVAQETFFRLLTRPDGITESVPAWLHRAATRLSIDVVRSESARKRREAEYAAVADREVSTWAELSPLVDEALAELPEAVRAILVAHFLEGRSQAQIAEEMEASPATISRRMRGALEMLQHALRRKGVTAGAAVLIALLPKGAAHAAPATLVRELGKMAMVGARAARGPVKLGGPRPGPSSAPPHPAAASVGMRLAAATKSMLVLAVTATVIFFIGLVLFRISRLGIMPSLQPAAPQQTTTHHD